ncbi:general odorant-binding protein 83a-like [Zootermopsis nevadensis]|uniref:Pheromone-binding protein-related protein 3 n=1 Tax=Zootermopsis nevadensis TaxID=136037 RepID=A0A067QLD1_ZOONE|nr:general odorant-binding protein 83a-like [Zootermopsis nevadensis]KDR09911.1 Pheromone-binding protein-related protein 3 [Zootermopsis nevadensis]
MLQFLTATAIFFVGTALAGSPLDKLDDDTKEMMKMLHDTCVDQTGVQESQIDSARHGEFTEDDHFKDYLGCVYQQTGALSEDGVADYDTIIGMLPELLADRGGKMITKCKHVKENSAAATAFELNKCLYKADPEFFFIF